MNIEDICEYCINKPGVTESFPFNPVGYHTRYEEVFEITKKLSALGVSITKQKISRMWRNAF